MQLRGICPTLRPLLAAGGMAAVNSAAITRVRIRSADNVLILVCILLPELKTPHQIYQPNFRFFTISCHIVILGTAIFCFPQNKSSQLLIFYL